MFRPARRSCFVLVLPLVIVAAEPMMAGQADDQAALRRNTEASLATLRPVIEQAEARWRSQFVGRIKSGAGQPLPQAEVVREVRRAYQALDDGGRRIETLARQLQERQIHELVFGASLDDVFIEAVITTWDLHLTETRYVLAVLQAAVDEQSVAVQREWAQTIDAVSRRETDLTTRQRIIDSAAPPIAQREAQHLDAITREVRAGATRLATARQQLLDLVQARAAAAQQGRRAGAPEKLTAVIDSHLATVGQAGGLGTSLDVLLESAVLNVPIVVNRELPKRIALADYVNPLFAERLTADPILEFPPMRPLRLWVRTANGLEPASRVIEGLPMMAEIAFGDGPATPLELTLRSGKESLVLTARPVSVRDDADEMWRNVSRTPEFIVMAADPPRQPEVEPGRRPTTSDWAALAGTWRAIYRDAILGPIEGWVRITESGQVSARYQPPNERSWRELSLESARILGEQSQSADHSLSRSPRKKWLLVFKGQGVDSPPPTSGVASQTLARLVLAKPDQVLFEGENVEGEAAVQWRDVADAQRMRLELSGEDGDVLDWNWSYRADRLTGRDAGGGGRAGKLLPPDPEDSTVVMMTGREAWIRAKPEIVAAISLDDQLALEPGRKFDDQPVERYRYAVRTRRLSTGGVDTLARSGVSSRRVFVVTRGLVPADVGPLTVERGEGNAIREYRVIARGAEGDWRNTKEIDEAWAEFRARVPRDPAAGVSADEGILVLATLNSEALPGYQPLIVNGAPASWRLAFGDMAAALQAVRLLSPGGPGEADEFEATSHLFVPERFRLAVEARVELPGREEIAVAVASDVTPDTPITVTLRRDPNLRTRYVSPDIELVHPKDLTEAKQRQPEAFLIAASPKGMVKAMPEFDPGYFVLPMSLEVPVMNTPERIHRHWKSRLQDAARLAGRPVEDWNAIALGQAGAQTNVIVSELVLNGPVSALGDFRTLMEDLTVTARKYNIQIPLASWWRREAGSRDGIRQIPISIGDHAAMLLLRDEFVVMVQEQLADWRRNGSAASLRSIYAAQRDAVGSRHSPLSFSKITLNTLPAVVLSDVVVGIDDLLGKKDETCQLYELFDDEFLKTLLGGRQDPRLMERVRLAAFSRAFEDWGTAMVSAMASARAIPDRDVKALLALTGSGFEAVAHRLLPNLLELGNDPASGSRARWTPDRVARAYVKGLGALGEAVRAQQSYSDIDSNLAWAAVSIASIPLGNLGGFWSAMAAFAVSAADLGHSLYSDWWMNDERERQLRFEIGAGAVLGYRRAKEADAVIVRGWQQAVSIGGSLVGFGVDLGGVATAVKAMKTAEVLEEGARLAAKIDFADSRAMRTLPVEQRAVLVRLAEEAQDVARAGGQATLTPAQAKALQHKAAIDATPVPTIDAAPGMAAPTPSMRAIGIPVETPGSRIPVPRQINDNTCGISVARSTIERFLNRLVGEQEMAQRAILSGRGYKTGMDFANGRLTQGGTWPSEMVEMLEDYGVLTRVPFGKKLRRNALTTEAGAGIGRRMGDTGGRTVAPDPNLEKIEFTLDDAGRELREGNQVLAVVDYARREGRGESPHWVVIEEVGTGGFRQDGKLVIDGPYVIIGDPAHGKSVAISRDDFLRHWRPEASVIAVNPSKSGGVPLRATSSPPSRAVIDSPPLAGSGPAPGARYPDQSGYLQASNPVPFYVSDAHAFIRRSDPQNADSRMAALLDACDDYLVRYARGLDPTDDRTIFNELVSRLTGLPPYLVQRFVARLEFQKLNKELFLGGRALDHIPAGLDFKTTTAELRRYARTLPYRDPITFSGKAVPVPRLGRIEADHIFPVAWILNRENSSNGLRNFWKLKREYQIQVVRNELNIQPLTPEMNNLKSNLSNADWSDKIRTAKRGPGLSSDYLEWLENKQEVLRKLLQDQIDDLLRKQASEARPGQARLERSPYDRLGLVA